MTTTAIVAVVLLVAFEAYAVVTAMPVAARALGGVRDYGLAFSLFMTTSLLGIVLAGGWNDRHGPAGPMLLGLATFALGLVLCGLAGSFAVLLAGRAVSGLGAGLEMVSLYVLVAGAYAEPLQPRVFGVISAGWVLPSLIGPPIAGFLATQVSWRAVFLAVPPLVALPLPVLTARLRALRPGEPPADAASARSLVLRGCVLAGAAAALQWGLHATSRLPGLVVAGAGMALVLAVLPGLMPAGVLRVRRGLPALVVFRAMITASFFGAEVFVPLMLVAQRGLAPAPSGLVLTAGAIGWFIGSWTQGRPGLRIERTTLVVVGGATLGAGVLTMVAAPQPGVPVPAVALFWAIAGLGMGWSMACSSVLLLRLSAPGQQGRNASAMQIGDSLGGVLGIGVAGALFAAGHHPAGDDTGVYGLIWVVLGGIGLLSALAGARIRPRVSGSP
jgi:MFS family permease